MEQQTAYERVYHSIKEDIESKKLSIGALLPPEPELERLFGVSRTTIRRAISMLVNDGLVVVKQGSGTRVVSRKSVQSLNKFTSISESLENKGYVVSTESFYLEVVSAGAEIAELLGIEPTEKVVSISRVKVADNRPVCICKNYIKQSLVPGIENEGSISHLYQFLRTRYNIVFSSHRDIISAKSASFEEAQVLKIEPRSALLTTKRVCFVDGIPGEVDFVSIVADMYEYELNFNQ